jgi:hypothetical protein
MPPRQFRRDPQTPQRQSIDAARAQVQLPALALFLVAGFWASALLVLTVVRVVATTAAIEQGNPGDPIPRETILMVRTTWSAIMLIASIVIAIGALQMYQLRSRQLAYLAVVLSLIPCIAPCYIGALPFGIWALMVLRRPEVDQAFADNAQLRIDEELQTESEKR